MSVAYFPDRLRGVVVALAVVVTASVAGAADAKKNEQLDRLGKLSTLAGQKMESEVRSALVESLKLVRTDRDRAVDVLKKALGNVEDDNLLTEKRRDALKRMLKDRIRITENASAKDEVDEKALASTGKKTEADKKLEERENLKTGLLEIANLRRDGKLADANKVAADLAKQFPESAAARASRRTTSVSDQVASARELRREREARSADVIRGVERSAIPPAGDIEFPKDWKEKTERRKAYTQTITAKERAILKALDTPIKIDFEQTRFEDAIEYIATLIDQPIVIDKAALEQAQVTYDSPINLRLPKVTARTVLRNILGQFGLTYIIQEQTIQITSEIRAREMMVARAYYIGDLLRGDLGLLFGWPGVGQLQMAQNAAAVIDLIQTSVDPSSWQSQGGNGRGSIYYHAPTMSLIIKQSAEVHSILNSIR